MTVLHPAARELLLHAVDNGWSAALTHGVDTEGSPFVSVDAKRLTEPYAVRVTWHTRFTGTYRLFSAMVGSGGRCRDVTLTAARAALLQEGGA